MPGSPPVAIARNARSGGVRELHALGAAGLSAVVLAGQSMASLDASIVNVAAPAIRHGFQISSATLQLVVYSYLLVYAVSLVPAARVGARAGFGRTFTRGVALFTASSLVCGLAPDAATLVAARAIQGFGAALMVAQVLSLLHVLDGQARARAMAFYGAVLALGVAAGQVLGGVLLEADVLGAGWRPIFLVNVPVGIVVTAVGIGRLPAGARTHTGPLDLRGALVLAGGMLTLLVPISFGGSAGWPLWCWPAFAASFGLVVVLVRHLRRLSAPGGMPVIDPVLLGRGGVGTELAGVFVLMACYGGLLFTVALYLQTTLHDSPLRSGLTFAAYACGFAIASMTWHRLPAPLHRSIPGTAFVLFAASSVSLAVATSSGWPVYATGLLTLAGAAHGAGFGALVRRVGGRITVDQTTAWSGLLATTTQLAIATGIACAGTIFQAGGLLPVLGGLAGLQCVAAGTIAASRHLSRTAARS